MCVCHGQVCEVWTCVVTDRGVRFRCVVTDRCVRFGCVS